MNQRIPQTRLDGEPGDKPTFSNANAFEQVSQPSGVDSNSKTEPSAERDVTPEQVRHHWRHSRLIVVGQAAYADILDRDRDKVGEVNILLTTREHLVDQGSGVDSIDDLRGIMDEAEFDYFSSWIIAQGHEGKPITVNRWQEVSVPWKEPIKSGAKVQIWQKLDLPPADDTPQGYLQNEPQLELQLESKPEIPERLEPNGTLAMALEAMTLGEKFGLKYDDTALRNADKMSRNGSLELRTVDVRDENGFITPAVVEQFGHRDTAILASAKYPVLSQIANQILQDGGIIPYILKHYGAVYLDENQSQQRVKLYDLKLVDSPASQDEQLKFLTFWRSKPEQLTATGDIVKISDRSDLPLPDGIEGLIDQEKLHTAVGARLGHPSALDSTAGTYELTVAGNLPQIRQKAEAYLRIMGMPPLDGISTNSQKIGRALIQSGVHPQNPILSQLGIKPQHETQLVISHRPEDMLQASYKKAWTSCVDLDGGSHANGLYEDIANGAVIAYLISDGKFLARVIIRSGVTLDDSHAPAAAIETVYGDERYQLLMHHAIADIISGAKIAIHQPMVTLPYSDEVYFDSDEYHAPSGERYYYGTPEELNI